MLMKAVQVHARVMVSFVARDAGAFLGKWMLSTPSLYDALPPAVSAASGTMMLRLTYTLDRSVRYLGLQINI
jgi:hypothetical protein